MGRNTQQPGLGRAKSGSRQCHVDLAAKFTEDVLLDGAGLEQIGTDLLRRRWPTRSRGIQGLRAYDDPSDRAAISLGVELYRLVLNHVTAKHLVSSILVTADLEVRPAASKAAGP